MFALIFPQKSLLGGQLIYRWCRKTPIVVSDPSCFQRAHSTAAYSAVYSHPERFSPTTYWG